MYSQKDEEAHILRAVEGIEAGTFMDIGAYDGYNYSNTMRLVERGWRGIMVEPGLEAFQALLERHGSNKNLTLVHAAIGSGEMTKFWNNPRTFSTTHEPNTERFKFEGFAEPYLVPTVTSYQVLRAAGFSKLDVLSIDTEGTSLSVIAQFPFELFTPRVVCVEHDGGISSLPGMLGYRIAMRNEENIIFVR